MTEAAPEAPIDSESRIRTHLANERTFLAWFRTGITLIALGLAGGQFLAKGGTSIWHPILLLTVGTIVAGIGLLLIGRARYVRTARLIERGEFRPAAHSVDIAVAVFALAGALAAAVVLAERLGG